MSSSSNTNGRLNVAVIDADFTTILADDTRVIDDLSPQITITFHNISKVIHVPGKMVDHTSKEKSIEKTLLDNISGQIHPGQLVALMGPSGCGKTTLLDVLAGRTSNGVTGDIWINNQRYEKSMKHKLAYVLQQDIFFENLTVKQQLTFTALLRLPKTLTRQDKLLQVEDIIEQLRLQTCANTPIMLISGGEKKRVNIATELLTNPSVILLDEPTSGLDSTSAVNLIGVLRELASRGKTIMTSIHQPSSHIFQSFDQLILLADGKTIFMGKPSNVLNYFGTLGHNSPAQYNPADFIMDLVVNQDMNIREQLKQAYDQNKFSISKKQSSKYSMEGQKYLTNEPSGNEADLPNGHGVKINEGNHDSKWPIGVFAQTSVLFRRNWLLTSKSQFSVLNFFQAFCLSAIFGLFWLRMDYNEKTVRDRASLLYFLVTYWAFEVCLGGILSFPPERSVIDKERASGSFRLSAYYLAKCLSETPLKLVLPTIFITITYWMANMNPNFGIFLGILIVMLMTVLVAESLGLLLGAVFQDLGKGWVAANITLLGFLLAGGYYIENIPYWLQIWAKWLSFFKYGYDASLQLQFMGKRLYQCVNGAYIDVCKTNLNGTFTGDDALKYFKTDLGIGLNFLILFGMFIALRIAVYIALRFIKNHDGRT